MATTTLTHNHQLITVPANTDEHDIDFNNVLKGSNGSAALELVSGTTVQVNSNGVTIDSACGSINSTQTKLAIPIYRGTNIKYKGGAGSETFHVTIWNTPI